MKVFLFAFIAAVGNALFVYGQRGSQSSDNPYFFLLSTLVVCSAIFTVCALTSKAPMESSYLAGNAKYILLSGIGFFVTFIGFYWLYSEQGATKLSILTTSIGVGLIISENPLTSTTWFPGCWRWLRFCFMALDKTSWQVSAWRPV